MIRPHEYLTAEGLLGDLLLCFVSSFDVHLFAFFCFRFSCRSFRKALCDVYTGCIYILTYLDSSSFMLEMEVQQQRERWVLEQVHIKKTQELVNVSVSKGALSKTMI